MNLYQKLHHIQCNILGLGKDTNGNNYKYVSGSKVLSEIKPLMNELGLLLVQEVVSITNTRMDYATKSNPNKSEILSCLQMNFVWIDAETGEKLVVPFGANGQNDWDKGVGSALTYAERYFLLKFFHIATDEDDIDTIEKTKRQEVASSKTEAQLKELIDSSQTLQHLTSVYTNNRPLIDTNSNLLTHLKNKKNQLKDEQA